MTGKRICISVPLPTTDCTNGVSMCFHPTFAKIQAKTISTVAACRGTIYLIEPLEDVRDLIL